MAATDAYARSINHPLPTGAHRLRRTATWQMVMQRQLEAITESQWNALPR